MGTCRAIWLVGMLISALLFTTAADKYALVDISTAYVRSRPSHSGELVTQQLMGFPVKILSSEGEWSHVETIDGYHGYIINNTLTPVSAAEHAAWKKADRVVVTGYKELVVNDDNGNQISDIVPGAILVEHGKCVEAPALSVVELPDGRMGRMETQNLLSLSEWSAQHLSPDNIIGYGMANLGAPYLWGGMSPKGMDCSGLTWVAYWLNGRLLQRDASQQALMGQKIREWQRLKAGDLAFFGNPKTGRITHVALLRDNAGNIVHASQGRVRLNSLDPASPDFIGATFLWGVSADAFPAVMDSEKSSWLF